MIDPKQGFVRCPNCDYPEVLPGGTCPRCRTQVRKLPKKS